MIVLDTNVASELMRQHPAPQVERWVRTQSAAQLCTTAVTVAEIRYGIERLPDGQRKGVLRTAATAIFAMFPDQILPFDAAAADLYAVVVSNCEAAGVPIAGFDAQIASICAARGASLATRNLRDFRETGVDLIDPWDEETRPPATFR
jgi:toxin FitB